MSLCPFIFKDQESSSYGKDSSGPGAYSPARNSFDAISIESSKLAEFLKKYGTWLAHRFLSSKVDRIKLAQNPNLTEEQIQIVLNDPSPIVRLELAWNTSVSQDILRKLIRDKDRTVSTVARRRLIKTTGEVEIPLL